VTVAVFMSGVVSVILRSAVVGGPTRTGRGRWWARRRGQAVAALMLGFAAGPALAHEDAVLEVFTRAGCPRCELAGRFLAGLQADRPGLQIESRRVDEDPAALARDAVHLTAEGYRLAEVQPLDMAPQTAQVDSVALWARS